MTLKKPRIRPALVIFVSIILVIGVAIGVVTLPSLLAHKSTTTSANPCVIEGQPAGMFLKIASDNGGTPIVGARITATHKQADDTCNGVLYYGKITTTSFTTNGTAWYPLDSTNDGSYSIVVRYFGYSFNLSAGMRPVSITCAILHVPSGRTNVTISEFKTTCD